MLEKTQPKAVNSVSYNNDYSGFVKVDPMEISTIFLNTTLALFLLAMAIGMIYCSFELIKNLRAKRLLDSELFEEFKKYDQALHKINLDLDNLGRKVRNLEQRK